MTEAEFREIALSFPGAVEGGHMGHADFRAGKKRRIFASLGAPGPDWGMVNLTPDQRDRLALLSPEAFVPCAGAWGERGYTNVRLASADAALLRSALELAYENVTGG